MFVGFGVAGSRTERPRVLVPLYILLVESGLARGLRKGRPMMPTCGYEDATEDVPGEGDSEDREAAREWQRV